MANSDAIGFCGDTVGVPDGVSESIAVVVDGIAVTTATAAAVVGSESFEVGDEIGDGMVGDDG